MHPLLVVFAVAGAVAAFCWVASLITRDHSWVDRLWSIVPVVYVWIFAGAAGFGDARLNIMAGLVTLWGARLTYNFARKGGYTGVEDYRWPILRERFGPARFALITLPAYTAYEHRGTPVGILDFLVAFVFLALLAGETVADQQQWDFHQAKNAALAAGEQPRTRFLQTGLWRYSRHPNFFFEQAQWWTLFFFGAIAAGSVLQWTVLGAALLTGLFVGSTIFTESITRSKYPEYADYQATTSAIVPFPPRAGRVARPA
jgi:steroid 5-alpha reductase family enzyme